MDVNELIHVSADLGALGDFLASDRVLTILDQPLSLPIGSSNDVLNAEQTQIS